MNEQEKKRLQELVAKKKSKSLTNEEAKELEELNKKCGYKPRKQGKYSGKNEGGFKPGNDFSWWNKEGTLLKDAANFKCNYIAGTAIAGTDVPYVIPGVVRVVLESTYGSEHRATDALNVWARDLYLRMFQKYRPASSYSASDLGITLLAENEVVKLIAKYERIYGVINRYSRLNVNMPLVECAALGLTSTEVSYLQSHLSDFRYDLNMLIRKAQRLCIPKDMSILADAISLFGYEYLDHDNARAQIIVFDTDKFGLYDETTLSTGGAIQFNDIDSSTPLFDFNANNMCNVLEVTLSALLGSDSVQRIVADLVVWFGEAAMLAFNPVPEEYIVVPVYSESILHKMHNMEMIGSATDLIVSWADNNLTSADAGVVNNGQHWVYQCNDRIITRCGIEITTGTHSTITFDGGTILGSNGGYPATITNCHVLDTYRVEVDPEAITEGVLFKFGVNKTSSSGTYADVIYSAAFYIARSIEIHTNGSSPVVLNTTTINAYTTALQRAGSLAILDWAPLVYNITTGGQITHIYGDLDSVVPLYGNDLSRLQRTIILSGVKTDATVINK